MAGFLFWLLVYRVLYRRNSSAPPVHLLVLTIVTALVTALGEAGIYMAKSGINAWRILPAHFDLDMEIRPAWWVLAAGLLVVAFGWWRWKPARQRAKARTISASAMSGATQVQSGS